MIINLSNDPKVYEGIRYPAGELQVRILPEFIEEIEAAKEITINARLTNRHLGDTNAGMAVDTMALLLLSDAIHGINERANQILNIPYLPYSRGDRRFVPGDCHGLATFGLLLSTAGEFHEIRTLDVHNFKHANNFVHGLVNVWPIDIIIKSVIDFAGGAGSITVLLPDAGALNRYDLQQLKKLDNVSVNLNFAIKQRDPATGKLTGFKVPDKFYTDRILIIDDICDGGGTFVGIAEEIRKVNPTATLGLYVTHGIFSKGIWALSGFDAVYTTDSLIQPVASSYRPFLKVYDAFEVLATGPVTKILEKSYV